MPFARLLLRGSLADLRWYTTNAQRRSLLRLLAVASEENLSLIPLLECWAEDERGRQRRRILRLVRLLNAGRTLPEAIEAVPGVVREEDALAIRFDAQSGTRTAAMRNALSQQEAIDRSAVVRMRRPIVYLCVLLPVAFLIVAFLYLKIRPVLQKIFSEFAVPEPGSMRLANEVSGAFLQGGWLLALGLLLLLMLLFFTRTGRRIRQASIGRVFRPMRAWHIADILQKVGLASRAGRPVTGAMSTLARYHFDPQVRQDLLYVRNEMEQGAYIWHSMADVGMLTPADVRALKSAERLGNLPWVLDRLASVKRRRTSSQMHRWSQLVLPLIILLMGAFVLLQALAIFGPLTALIRDLF